MIVIGENIVVFFRYVMRNARGEEVENIMEGPSKSYLHGSANILPCLQTQMEGLKVGERKTVLLVPERADPSGTAIPSPDGGVPEEGIASFTFEVVIDQLRPALTEEILLGYPVVVADRICDADCDC